MGAIRLGRFQVVVVRHIAQFVEVRCGVEAFELGDAAGFGSHGRFDPGWAAYFDRTFGG